MSERDFIYGVFSEAEQGAAVVADLHASGIAESDINFITSNDKQSKTVSARLTNPTKKFMVAFGVIGTIGGMIAGALMAPALPGEGSFQVVTTLMAAVSCGLVVGYVGSITAAILYANQPQYYANIYEGVLPRGKVVVSLEAEGNEQIETAFKLMSSHDALEIIMQRAEAASFIGMEETETQSAIVSSEAEQNLNLAA
jgi:hypothetical protein